jgi:hypothetical protein
MAIRVTYAYEELLGLKNFSNVKVGVILSSDKDCTTFEEVKRASKALAATAKQLVYEDMEEERKKYGLK